MPLPEPAYQNSAGRLLSILSALPEGKALLQLIPDLFGSGGATKEEKQQACLAGLMEIHSLYLQFRQDMLEAPISEQTRNVLFNGLVSIQQSIYPLNLEGGFRVLTPAEKSLLEMAATIVAQEPKLESDDLEAIRESIASLRALVESAEISPTIRKVLLELIRMSEDAIARFNIHGARGIRKAFKMMLAEAAELYGLASGGKDREELKKSGIWAAIVKHLRLLDAISAKVCERLPLIEKAGQWLLGGPLDGGSQ